MGESMKAKISLLTVLAALALLTHARGQGTFFRNLDFEEANVSGYPSPGWVPIADAMPGWSAYVDGPYSYGLGEVIYNSVPIGTAQITLQGPGSPYPILQGSYMVFPWPSTSGAFIPSIFQTGTVPASAQSIRFYTSYRGPSLTGFVTFAGGTIPIELIENTPNYAIYGGNISSFANQTGELRFRGGGFLDNIFFSSQPIPEPGAVSLLAVGVSFLWLHRRK